MLPLQETTAPFISRRDTARECVVWPFIRRRGGGGRPKVRTGGGGVSQKYAMRIRGEGGQKRPIFCVRTCCTDPDRIQAAESDVFRIAVQRHDRRCLQDKLCESDSTRVIGAKPRSPVPSLIARMEYDSRTDHTPSHFTPCLLLLGAAYCHKDRLGRYDGNATTERPSQWHSMARRSQAAGNEACCSTPGQINDCYSIRTSCKNSCAFQRLSQWNIYAIFLNWIFYAFHGNLNHWLRFFFLCSFFSLMCELFFMFLCSYIVVFILLMIAFISLL